MNMLEQVLQQICELEKKHANDFDFGQKVRELLHLNGLLLPNPAMAPEAK
jgi:hypothetical protein